MLGNRSKYPGQKAGNDVISKSQFLRLDPDLDSAPPRGRPQPAAVQHGQLNAQLPALQAAAPAVPHLYPDLDLVTVEELDRPPYVAAHTPRRTRKGTNSASTDGGGGRWRRKHAADL